MEATDIPKSMWKYLDDYPIAQPPKGVIPNFEHPKLMGHHAVTFASGICMVLVCAFALARLYSKLFILRCTRIDDYMFWISLPPYLANMCMFIYLDHSGTVGYYPYEIKIRVLTKAVLVITYVYPIILPITNATIKITLFCLILSAFKSVKALRYLCYAGIVTTLGYYIPNLIIHTVTCYPHGGHDRIAYLAGMASRRCSQGISYDVSIATGSFNLLSDMYILTMPMPAVARLRISRVKKIGVSMIFSAGGVACMASLLSLIFRTRTWTKDDIFVSTIPAIVANIVELSVGLMITCIGPIEKLVRHVLKQNFPTVLGSTIPKTGSHDDLRPGGNKKIHRKGGLSEIDSMRTCGTTVDRLEYQTEDTAARTTSTSSDLVGSEIRTQLPPQMHVSDRFEV